jgi:hypothetical protein
VSQAAVRTWAPLALLAVAVVAAVSVLRRPSTPPEPAPSESALDPGAGDAPLPPGSQARLDDPPLTDVERRDSRMRLAHELCEAGAIRINELSGLPREDPQGRRTISVCLRHGNVAWYKCILAAGDRDHALACNRRLLVGDNAP